MREELPEGDFKWDSLRKGLVCNSVSSSPKCGCVMGPFSVCRIVYKESAFSIHPMSSRNRDTIVSGMIGLIRAVSVG